MGLPEPTSWNAWGYLLERQRRQSTTRGYLGLSLGTLGASSWNGKAAIHYLGLPGATSWNAWGYLLERQRRQFTTWGHLNLLLGTLGATSWNGKSGNPLLGATLVVLSLGTLKVCPWNGTAAIHYLGLPLGTAKTTIHYDWVYPLEKQMQQFTTLGLPEPPFWNAWGYL